MHSDFRKVLITGAGGMLGADLVESFRSGYEVCAAGRRPASHLSIPTASIDFSDIVQVDALWNNLKPHVVFHCAAMTDVDGCESNPDEAFRDNVLATQNVVRATNEMGALLVFFSTDYVFDGKKDSPYLETDPVSPVNKYGETKALAEKYIQGNSSRYLIIRVSWLYGKFGKSFPRTILEKAKVQKKFQIVDDQIGRPTYTADLASELRRLLDNKASLPIEKCNQIFHLGNGGFVSWADFALYIFKHCGLADCDVQRISSDQLRRPAQRPKNSVLSLEKAGNILGIRMRPWNEAVSDFINTSGIVIPQ